MVEMEGAMKMVNAAIWLRRDGDIVKVLMEKRNDDGVSEWVELIREHYDSPFSHIIEPSGIEDRLANVTT